MAWTTEEYADAIAVTPSDTADNSYRAIYVGGVGDLAVVSEVGTSVTFKAVPVGMVLRIHTAKVLATGTTATNVVGFRAG